MLVRRIYSGNTPSRLLVLGFHNVEGTWCWPAPPGQGARRFAQQMRILHQFTNVVDLRTGLDALASGKPLPPRAVALTFDDGYRDNLTIAAPILRRFNMPATIYLVPGILDRSVHAWWERLGWAVGNATARELEYRGTKVQLKSRENRVVIQRQIERDVKQLSHVARAACVDDLVDQLAPDGCYEFDRHFLDWDQAKELHDAGLTVGSHTIEHPILSRESASDQRTTLQTSKRVLEENLHIEVPTFAYPNGTRSDYDETTISEVARAGYSYAVTTWGPPASSEDSPFEVHRSLVGASMHPLRFAAFIAKRLLYNV